MVVSCWRVRMHVIPQHELRDVAPEGDRRLRWIEEFLKQNPETAIVDSISHVAKVINRVSMLEVMCSGRLPRIGSAVLQA